MSDTSPLDKPAPPVATRPDDRRRRLGDTALTWGCGAVAGAVLITFVGLAVLIYQNWDTVGQRIGPSCTIGLIDTTQTMTIQGWDAKSQCDYWLHNLGSYGPGYYAYQGGTPQNPILCQEVYKRDLYTVHGLSAQDPNTSEDFCIDLAHMMSP